MPKSGYVKFGVGLDEAEKREHIQAAAKRVFGRLGYQRATVQDIISEAGISRRTFYSYFKSKEDVLARVLDRFAMDMTQIRDIETPNRLRNVEELREQIKRLARMILTVILDNRELVKLLLEGRVMDDEVLAPRSANIHETFRAFIQEYVQISQKKGLVPKFDPEIMSSILMGAYIELIRTYLLQPSRLSVEELAREIISFLNDVLITEKK